MSKSSIGQSFLIVIALTVVSTQSPSAARGVVLYRSEQRNLTAPTGAFANSGWDLQGQWGGFVGTPIAPHYFITANHIGGSAAIPFVYQAVGYLPDATFNGGQGSIRVPGTDLRIWKVTNAFPSYAELFDQSVDGAATGKVLIDFGRGVARGAPIYGEVVQENGNGAKTGELKGWGWGTEDGLLSWGTNVVNGTVNGGSTYGTLLTYTFDRNGLYDEGSLINEDSGGGAFIQGAGGVWKLAGINSATDGPYRLSAPATGVDTDAIFGPMFDEGGLYESIGNGQYVLHPEQAQDLPGSCYLSSVPDNIAFIRSVIGIPPTRSTPEPASALAVTLLLSCRALYRRQPRDGERTRLA